MSAVALILTFNIGVNGSFIDAAWRLQVSLKNTSDHGLACSFTRVSYSCIRQTVSQIALRICSKQILGLKRKLSCKATIQTSRWIAYFARLQEAVASNMAAIQESGAVLMSG
eukprot:scaffold173703_cov37-Prasinocladus_malaysianus.AAC.1